MTPPPANAAAAGHQRTVRRGTTPRGPRRVSGPSRAAGGARAARANAATAAAAAAAVNPNQLPFEVPVGRRTAVARPVGLPRNHTPLVHRLGRVAEHSWLDRLLRSRAWIVVVGIGLIGLVFMQVSLLKLNSSMGRAVERSTVLERGNALLQADVSQLESNDRIQQKAIQMGMVLPASDGVRYLGRDGKRIGGGSTTLVPSQAEASTALLPTAPVDDTEHPATTGTTGTATTPQTTSSVPGAAAAVPQSTSTSTGVAQGAAATTPPATTATGTGTATSATTQSSATGTTSATGAAATGAAAAAATTAATSTGSAVRTDPASTAVTGGATPGA
jgi:cell division protein FtsL